MTRSPFVGFAVAALMVAWSTPAGASDLQLTIKDGRVTLVADGASARQILEEWATVGGATVVNADKLTGPPLTLRLEDVPERDALDVVLRAAAGYVAAPRRPGTEGVSLFGRILVLAASKAPPAPARSMSAPAPAPYSPAPVAGDVIYEPEPWPNDNAAEPPDQMRPLPGPFPGAFPGTAQPQEDVPVQPQLSPTPGFLPAPSQQQQPVMTMPPGYPGMPPTPPPPPRKPGGGGGR